MFGEVLKEFRQRRNMTLRQLGEKAGMDYVVVNKIELGSRVPPPLEGIMALADALELEEGEIEKLVDEAEPNKNANPRFTPDELRRIKESGSAQLFFTRQVRKREDQ